MQKRISITPALLEFFNQNVKFGQDSNGFFATIPDQLEKEKYDEVSKILEGMKGKWSTKRHRTEFLAGYDPISMMAKAQKDGFILIEKDGYFPTPAAVVQRMIELAELKVAYRVLEPSAGTGSIAACLIENGTPLVNIDVIEFNEARRDILSKAGYQVVGDDFLLYPITNQYEAVIMNPPFEAGQDIKHVLKAMKHLKPNGVLVAVVGAGFAFRKEYNELKSLIHFAEKLPDGSFKDSGTNIGSYVVVYKNDPEAVKEYSFDPSEESNIRIPAPEVEYEKPEKILADLFKEFAEINNCMTGLARELGMPESEIPQMPSLQPAGLNILLGQPSTQPISQPKKVQKHTAAAPAPSPQMSLFQ